MWIDEASSIDLLYFKPIALVINELLSSKKIPETIGLFGSWGSGKSTIINLIERENSINNQNVFIKINAWQLEGYDDTKSAIIEALLFALKCNTTIYNKIKLELDGLIKRLDIIKITKSLIKRGISIIENPLGALSKSVISSIDRQESGIIEQDNSFTENIRLFREDFENAINKSEISGMLIAIDDLDRCSPVNIIDILEAIKLFLSVKKTTFIFSIDNEILHSAIEHKFKLEKNSPQYSKNYIEKMIQVPIIIPALSNKEIINYIFLLNLERHLSHDNLQKIIEYIEANGLFLNYEHIKLEDYNMISKEVKVELSDECMNDLKLMVQIGPVISTSLRGNPRQTKRFLNEFALKKQLSKHYYKHNEIDNSVLAKILALSIISDAAFKELFDWNLKYNGEILEIKEILLSYINSTPVNFSNWNSNELKKWILCEPRELYKIDLSPYFMLTKEKIQPSSMESLHDTKTRLLLHEIGNLSGVLQHNKIKTIVSNKNESYILDILIEKYKSDYVNFSLIADIYLLSEKHRPIIENEVLTYIPSDKIGFADFPLLLSMYKVNQKAMEKILPKTKIEVDMIHKILGIEE